MRPIQLFSLSALLFSAPILAQGAASGIAGKVLAAQGLVEVRQSPWTPAKVNQLLRPGATVRTGARSRAAILLADETQLKLGANSDLQLREVRASSNLLQRIGKVAAGARQSIINLRSGKAWLRSKRKPARVRVSTPAVTAAIRGTEFVVDVAEDGESVVTVLEGAVDMRNDSGAIIVSSGEQGRARIGQAPTKTIVVNPDDAAQWTLSYSASVSPRDYPFLYRSPREAQAALDQGAKDPVQEAQLQHDAGNLAAALTRLEGLNTPAAAETRGWIRLEMNQLSAAVTALKQPASLTPRARLGLSLAHYRLNELEQAYQLVQDPGQDPGLKLQKAALDLIGGDVDRARGLLESIPESDPAYGLAQGRLAGVHLVQNRKEEALAAARRAVQASPNSPSAYLSLSQVQQSFFDLPAAIRSVETALRMDPEFLQAQVQYSRLLFGTGRTRRAEKVIREALAQAPEEASVHSMLGFVLLSQARTSQATTAFQRSLRLDSMRGEPHLGLGIAHMRQGQATEAVAEMLVATTLEPRLSLYQSYLGKAFYEERKLEQAFTALQTAIDLDPRDPTPHLYSGIIEEDLNRPGTAVSDFQESIRLNDNRAVYRGRFLLDQDRATRNVQLATAYNRLGLSEWANLEAVKSNLADATSSSAHLFLAGTFLNLPGRTGAAGSELLLTRLLLPVNTNSFNAFNDYTTLFEQPRLNWTSEGSYGNFDTFGGQMVATGGGSRYAYSSVFTYDRTGGFRQGLANFPQTEPQNDTSRSYAATHLFKFALTPHSDLLLTYSHQQNRLGDVAQTLVTERTDPDLRVSSRFHRVEVGYHHQLRPGSELLFYFSGRESKVVTDDGDAVLSPSLFNQCLLLGQSPPCGFLDRRSSLSNPGLNLQFSHLLRFSRVQIRYGTDLFGGRSNARIETFYRQDELFPGQDPRLIVSDPNVDRKDVRFYTGFLQADYAVSPKLVLTAGFNYDWANDDNAFIGSQDPVELNQELQVLFGTDGSTSQWNPQGGVLFSPFSSTTFRFAAARSLQPLVAGGAGGTATVSVRARLVPTHLNGFPLNLNEIELTRSDAYNFGWDQHMGEKMFLRATAFWRDRTIPTANADAATGLLAPADFEGDSYGAGVVWNQFLTDQLTLVSEYSLTSDEDLFSSRRDHRARIGMFYVHPRGWFFDVAENFLKQNGCLGRQCGARFGLNREVKAYTTDLGLTYEMPRKFGLLSFRVTNLFDRNYDLPAGLDGRGGFLVDPLALDPRVPQRQYNVSLRFNF
ncbi:MAG: TonB-dependent receptor domain-containing protein [Acidobacteriota bacterium]